jgi:hypothetical protein
MPTTEIKLPANAVFLTVPAGAKPRPCNGSSCSRWIFFARNPTTGRLTPIDCDVPGGKRPSELAHADKSQSDLFGSTPPKVFDGKGVSHYLTCANAGEFTRKATP